MAKRAVYPGMFDPVHNGHIDVIQRSLQIFDELIVAVVGGVRRIEKHDLEPPPLARQPRELPGDVAAGDVRARLELERPDVLDERVQGSPIALDERDVRSPARKRLESDATRAGEEIEQPRVGQPRPQRIHQCDPHLIRCRPRRHPLRRDKPPPLERSGDHPHGLKITRMGARPPTSTAGDHRSKSDGRR